MDSKERPFLDLRKEDVELYEDGTERKIESVRGNDAGHLTLGLLVDADMKHKFPFFRPRLSGSNDLLAPILKGGGSVVVAAFGDHLSASSATSDSEQLDEYVRRAASAWLGRKTALFDAIEEMCVTKLPSGRKALVVISDADDTSLDHPLSGAIRAVKLTRTRVFFLVTMPERLERFMDRQGWMMNARDASIQLAVATGGKAYRVHTEEEVDKAFEEIATRLNSEYAVTYDSRGPGSHTIKLRSARQGIKIVSQQDFPAAQN